MYFKPKQALHALRRARLAVLGTIYRYYLFIYYHYLFIYYLFIHYLFIFLCRVSVSSTVRVLSSILAEFDDADDQDLDDC